MLDPTIKHQPRNSFDLYDETRHETWESTNSNLWPSKKHIEMDDDEHEPRWSKNSQHYRPLSPVSRTEAIVRGQKELMEMVKNMPESNYELSLKDIVEHHHRVVSTIEENSEEEKNSNRHVGDKKIVNKTRSLKRNEKIDRGHGGFYLKVAFPFSLGSNKEKKKKNESKVSPRSSISDGFVKGVDKEKEWWKKSSSVYNKQSDSAASSTNSTESMKSTSSSSKSSSSNRSKRIRSNSIRRDQKSGGRCWPLFCKPKSQTKK